MLAGIPVAADSVAELASMVSVAGAVELAERLERALDAEVNVLALTFDERAILLAALDDPPAELAELRAVLLKEEERVSGPHFADNPSRGDHERSRVDVWPFTVANGRELEDGSYRFVVPSLTIPGSPALRPRGAVRDRLDGGGASRGVRLQATTQVASVLADRVTHIYTFRMADRELCRVA